MGGHMDLTPKDGFLVLAGFVASVVASGVWQWWSLRTKQARDSGRKLQEEWRARLNHQGFIPRVEAANDIIVRAIYWLVLGNLMFFLSGLTLVFELTLI